MAAAEAAERKRVLPDECFVNSDVTVDAPIGLVFDLMLKPDVMQRYLLADAVDAVPGARGEDLGSEFHCHHGGSVVAMRVVSVDPGAELTLTADKPTAMYLTTRLNDAGDGHTRISRSFIWDVPSDPEVAKSVRAMMEGVAVAGEGALREVFEERAKASRI
jgi:uncharacterized protein YndB with AHSA1/START domain